MMAPYGAPAANVALSCPRCGAGASPSPGAQVCPRCAGAFTLRAGAQMDASSVPPPYDPRLKRIVVKSAGIVLLKRGMLAAEGVTEGILDPITGLIPMNESGVLYPDVHSIAVWRKIDVLRLAVALVIPVPLTLFFVVEAILVHPGFLIAAFPFALVSAYMLYRALGLKANMVRVVGSMRIVTIRFDSPMWRRKSFHDELLRRSGMAPGAIP